MFNLQKKGFTLIEILISMGLVGILIAVMSPNLSKVLPDKNKAMFIKAFTRTENAVAAMLSDPDMYRNRYDYDTMKYDRYGLCNTSTPQGLLAANGNLPPSGTNKFAFYFAQEVGGVLDASNNVKTNDGIIYAIKWEDANKDSTDRDAVAATITIKVEDESVASIEVINDGAILCGDNTCKTYLKDRFNLKKKS